MSGLFIKPLSADQIQRINAWAEALESGKYQQGREWLRDGNRFCCLGVACDISGIGLWAWSTAYACLTDSSERNLPADVRQFYGIKSASGDMSPGDALTELNDSGTTFPEIASIIRRELKEATSNV